MVKEIWYGDIKKGRGRLENELTDKMRELTKRIGNKYGKDIDILLTEEPIKLMIEIYRRHGEDTRGLEDTPARDLTLNSRDIEGKLEWVTIILDAYVLNVIGQINMVGEVREEESMCARVILHEIGHAHWNIRHKSADYGKYTHETKRVGKNMISAWDALHLIEEYNADLYAYGKIVNEYGKSKLKYLAENNVKMLREVLDKNKGYGLTSKLTILIATITSYRQLYGNKCIVKAEKISQRGKILIGDIDFTMYSCWKIVKDRNKIDAYIDQIVNNVDYVLRLVNGF